ncbi:hypothetical protein SELMODRAFT_440315 [Selaginella moellendorffii]|uniref:GST N-terminal domain-containing protein n=1 Tax=Selaginella moellendorffii TaxID=88036 RepID=D8RAY4_SELML|nr:hypothetical protein SELMODRAFT_440315 [Selaginella moellendorffii]
MEACPFCRRLYPCPKGSRVQRAFVKSSGGKEQFPFLLDPNTGTSMYESSDIVNYLFQEYGERSKPTFGILESTLVTGWVPKIIRAGGGMSLWNGALPNPPQKLLELYSNNHVAKRSPVRPGTSLHPLEKGHLIAPSSSKSRVQHRNEAFGASPGRFSATAGNELKVGRFEVLESKDELDLIGQQPPEPLRQFNQRFQSYIRPNLIREQDTVSWDKFCPIRDAETAC